MFSHMSRKAIIIVHAYFVAVPCPEGTYFSSESRQCQPCPVGTYNREIGQLQCQTCPEFQGKAGVTETMAAISVDECKGNIKILLAL